MAKEEKQGAEVSQQKSFKPSSYRLLLKPSTFGTTFSQGKDIGFEASKGRDITCKVCEIKMLTKVLKNTNVFYGQDRLFVFGMIVDGTFSRLDVLTWAVRD